MLWKSKFQTETSLSTMKAGIIALSRSCRYLFPIMNMENLFCKASELTILDTKIYLYIPEDNIVSFVITETLPHQFNLWRNNYASKNICFCEEIYKI